MTLLKNLQDRRERLLNEKNIQPNENTNMKVSSGFSNLLTDQVNRSTAKSLNELSTNDSLSMNTNTSLQNSNSENQQHVSNSNISASNNTIINNNFNNNQTLYDEILQNDSLNINNEEEETFKSIIEATEVTKIKKIKYDLPIEFVIVSDSSLSHILKPIITLSFLFIYFFNRYKRQKKPTP